MKKRSIAVGGHYSRGGMQQKGGTWPPEPAKKGCDGGNVPGRGDPANQGGQRGLGGRGIEQGERSRRGSNAAKARGARLMQPVGGGAMRLEGVSSKGGRDRARCGLRRGFGKGRARGKIGHGGGGNGGLEGRKGRGAAEGGDQARHGRGGGWFSSKGGLGWGQIGCDVAQGGSCKGGLRGRSGAKGGVGATASHRGRSKGGVGGHDRNGGRPRGWIEQGARKMGA